MSVGTGRSFVLANMPHSFKLEYWEDGPWFVGCLPQVPGVFSQGATLEELEENIHDAYRMMYPDSDFIVDALQRIS